MSGKLAESDEIKDFREKGRKKHLTQRNEFYAEVSHKAAISGLICAYAATGDYLKLQQAKLFEFELCMRSYYPFISLTYPLMKKFQPLDVSRFRRIVDRKLTDKKLNETQCEQLERFILQCDTTSMLSPYFNLADRRGHTPLHLAVLYEKPETALYLLARGANPDCLDKNGMTPLHLAVKEKKFDVVNTLLENDANTAILYKGLTFWEYAFVTGCMLLLPFPGAATLQYALKHSRNPAVWQYAIENMILTQLSASLRELWINKTDGLGRSPLHVAIDKKSLGVFEKLELAGASLKAKYNGMDVPTYCLEKDMPELALGLLKRKPALFAVPNIFKREDAKIPKGHILRKIVQKDAADLLEQMERAKLVTNFKPRLYYQAVLALAMECGATQVLTYITDLERDMPVVSKENIRPSSARNSAKLKSLRAVTSLSGYREDCRSEAGTPFGECSPLVDPC